MRSPPTQRPPPRRPVERPDSRRPSIGRAVPPGQHLVSPRRPHTDGEALEKLKSLKTNEHAKETLDRVISHLSDNNVHLGGKTEFRLGPHLQFDPQAETFINNPAAAALLTRDYRVPFVVPTAENV